jgi:ABC-2 type transport system ATP-binding protein
MEHAVVDVNELSRSFADKIALDGVSFRATGGQVYGLVGSNGAGKTTLLKHLLGLLRATTGSVRVFGLDPVRDPVGVLGRVGYLSEERELPEWMSIDELMRYTQAYHPGWDAAYARELLDTFALDPRKKIKELSKGMRAQAGLIAAVAHRPELLILDEPSSGLDVVVRRDILDAVVRAVADDGRTVIFSSHLLDEVERMSDHVTLMHQGRVALSGVLDDVRREYQRSRVRFAEHFDRPPVIETALMIEGGGRSWSVVHSGSLEQFRHAVAARGGEIVEPRDATLEEIFLARAGRGRAQAEAA